MSGTEYQPGMAGLVAVVQELSVALLQAQEELHRLSLTDELGHDHGDELIREAAILLADAFRGCPVSPGPSAPFRSTLSGEARMDQLVSGAWLEEQLGSPDLRLLDCTVTMQARPDGSRVYATGRAAWEAGHIPGSAHVDLVHELSDRSSPLPFMLPPPEQFATVMGQLGIGANSRVVLYDSYANAWAARVWWMLQAFGFDDAAVLDGGWRAWTEEGRPSSTEPEPKHEPAEFVPRYRPGLFVGKEEVLTALDDRHTCIVDALPEVVYRGDRQDYARPGHIPGARNVNFLRLVDKDTHRYLPEDQLRARIAPVVESEPSQVITYCGGAIAASSDAFVLNLLGVENVAIYDGSLSEWAADPALPLAVGD